MNEIRYRVPLGDTRGQMPYKNVYVVVVSLLLWGAIIALGAYFLS